MPIVQIKVVEGVMSAEQKRQMVSKVSEAVLSIEGENLRPFTHVVIEEVKSGDWAIGGKSLSTDEIKAVISGKNQAA